MQEGRLYPHSDQTIQMTLNGFCTLTSEHSTGSYETAPLVGGVENQLKRQSSVTEGNVSGVRQLRVSMDLVLLEHDLFGRPNLLV